MCRDFKRPKRTCQNAGIFVTTFTQQRRVRKDRFCFHTACSIMPHNTAEVMRGLLYSSCRVAARVAPIALACHYTTNSTNSTDCATFSASTYPANDPIEDRHLFRNAGDWGAAAVFDGHGGWQVSDYASQLLLDKVLSNIANVGERDEIALDTKIQEAFDSMESEIVNRVRPAFNLGFGEVAKVGSCVCVALKRADRLIVANCGDCRAILGTAVIAPNTAENNGNNKPVGDSVGINYVSTRITRDHNARVRLEQLRLEQDHPGEDSLYRCKNPHACYVKGRLQLTRSLGDEYLKHTEFNGTKDAHRSRCVKLLVVTFSGTALKGLSLTAEQ
jgi:serine/threonine protein phosphatase PrpC